MRTKIVSSFIRKALIDQAGQVLPWTILMLFGLIGMTGLTTDVGHAYNVKGPLKSCSDAAVLASAEEVYNTGTTSNATTLANQYSCSGLNSSATSVPVTTTVTPVCLNSLLPAGVTCADMKNAPNAIKVTETATVPTYFMRVLGIPSVTVTSTSTAAFGTTQPYNIAFILDSTPSMGSKDPNCGNIEAEQCAMNGIQLLLGKLNPCKGGAVGCEPGDASTLLRVAMFSFPNISVSDTAKDECASGTPVMQPYTFPKATTGYTELTMKTSGGVSTPTTYLISQPQWDTTNTDVNGFSSDYYSPTTSNNLNPNSKMISILGDGAGSGCMKEPSDPGFSGNTNGGSGITYQAGAIYAAQDALNAEQLVTNGLNITAVNVIIFVSDGQANSDSGTFIPTTDTITNGVGYTTRTGTGQYPDITQQCQQTIMASQYAQSQGTRVYGVAYGSETGGCSTDNKVVVTNTSGDPVTIGSTSQIVPCTIMEDMSSATGASSGLQYYFYGDVTSEANGCITNVNTGDGVNDIFNGILETLTAPRLVDNSLT